jgi:hypothetical protein
LVGRDVPFNRGEIFGIDATGGGGKILELFAHKHGTLSLTATALAFCVSVLIRVSIVQFIHQL